MNKYWLEYLLDEAKRKSTFKHLNFAFCTVGRLHPVWRKTPHSKTAILQASVQSKMLVGRYTLQEDLNKYRGINENCPLCLAAPESMFHFLYECINLQAIRDNYLPQLKQAVVVANSKDNWEKIQDFFARETLDRTRLSSVESG